jgi:hypothetical protein
MVYRILSLDGGGTWSLIQVKALIALYSNDTSGHAVLREFPKQPCFGKSRRKLKLATCTIIFPGRTEAQSNLLADAHRSGVAQDHRWYLEETKRLS